ncbi:MAG: hypothetical protein GY866_25065, partial [Proteobacteria bacterium]|nr:hypothetical protein [Pseudomonadota bacterium]
TEKPTVEHAQSLFERLLRAAGSIPHVTPRLIVLPEVAAKWENWAVSLPDGSVVLVENVLDLCFDHQNNPSEKGKSRLAFILAHELAHLINGDHVRVPRDDRLSFQKTTDRDGTSHLSRMEARADYTGLLLMTMADFQPNYLIDRTNFFLEYVDKVRTNTSYEEHSTPVGRMTTLKRNLEPIFRELPLFGNGVRLYGLGKYREAIESFRSFADFFPSREVYNNIGLSYYQWAMKELAAIDQKRLSRFMLATIIDTETLARKLLPADLGVPRGLRERFEEHLALAVRNLKLALQKDSGYMPAKINLSSAMIMVRDYHEALRYTDQVLEADPDNIEAVNNKAVAVYLANPTGNSHRAMLLLDRLARDKNNYSDRRLRFNTSRIRFERLQCQFDADDAKDSDCLVMARKSWSPFLEKDSKGPYARLVRRELGYDREPSSPAEENNRFALVIGNEDYHTNPLPNPANDAKAVKHALEHLGFEVELGLNLDRGEMLEKIATFGGKLTPATTGLFYYSGHGLQVQGENYLVPIGANDRISIGRTDDNRNSTRDITVNANLVLHRMKTAKNPQNIVILDACRNNPLPGVATGIQGLAEMNAPSGTYIAYSTSPGEIAWDGLSGKNGIFTQALLNHIHQPNLDIGELFQLVRKEVKENTNQYQITWDTSTLEKEYYFNPAKPQNWTWHIVAGTIALAAGWQAREEARKYRQYHEENRLLYERHASSLELAEFFSIESQYRVNQERMKNHKRNYEVLDVVTLGVLLWEVYLLAFETYNEGVYQPPETGWETDVALDNRNGEDRLSVGLRWNW